MKGSYQSIANVANIVQMKTAFMLHQDQCLDELGGLIPPVAFRLGKMLINAFGEVQRVHQLSRGQQTGPGRQ